MTTIVTTIVTGIATGIGKKERKAAIACVMLFGDAPAGAVAVTDHLTRFRIGCLRLNAGCCAIAPGRCWRR